MLVTLLAVVLPYVKLVGLALSQAGRLPPRAGPVLHHLGRFAMADVFLAALYIVVVKGVGLGRVETAWGLWLFTGCVAGALILAAGVRGAR